MKLLIDMRYACNHFPGIGRMSTALCHAFATHPAITQLSIITNPRQHNTRFHMPDTAAHLQHIPLYGRPFGVREAWHIAHIVAQTHADWMYTPYLRLPTAPLATKLMVTLHDAIPFTSPTPWWVRSGLRLAWLDTACRADIITTVSPHAAQQIRQHFWPPRPLHVIPNGVDAHFFTPAPALDRATFGIHGAYDLCVSSNQPHKNLATLVAAWADAYTQSPPLHPRQLVIAGQFDTSRAQPWLSAPYRHLPIVAIASPSDAVLHALYQQAEVFVYPSLAEGFGLPIAEAMASGCAIICHDHAVMRALVGDDAWIVDMHDATQLSQTLRHAWRDSTQRQRYANAVRQRAHTLQWAVSANTYIALMQHGT